MQSAQDQQRVPQADAVKQRGEDERQHDGEGAPAEGHEGEDEPQTSVEVVAEDDRDSVKAKPEPTRAPKDR